MEMYSCESSGFRADLVLVIEGRFDTSPPVRLVLVFIYFDGGKHMARPVSPHPTELELELLEVLWRNGPSTARQIQDGLSGHDDMRPSSVHIALSTMMRKGYVR